MKPPHTRISMIGRFAGSTDQTLEIWNWNLCAAEAGQRTPTELAVAAGGVVNAYATNLKSFFRSHVQLTRVRVAQIDEQGHVLQTSDGEYRQGDADTPQVGTSSSTYAYPLQAALAVSLDTARDGVSGKGRVFLPMPAITITDTDFRLPSTNIDAFAAAFVAFLGDVNNALETLDALPRPVSVVSSKGFVSPVTGIRIGRVVDTQRRRRGDLVEDYRSASL